MCLATAVGTAALAVEVDNEDTLLTAVEEKSGNQVLSADANISCASCAPASIGVLEKPDSSPNELLAVPFIFASVVASKLKSEQ